MCACCCGDAASTLAGKTLMPATGSAAASASAPHKALDFTCLIAGPPWGPPIFMPSGLDGRRSLTYEGQTVPPAYPSNGTQDEALSVAPYRPNEVRLRDVEHQVQE